MIFQIIYLILLFFGTFFIVFHLNLWFENKENIFLKSTVKTMSTISLIVPAYNEEDIIEETLKKLKSINYPKNKLEVIVVDDGSTDRTYETAKGAVKKFKLKRIRVFTKKNGGKASALNFGIKKVKHEFIAVMDADSFLGKDALKKCMGHFDSNDVAAVTSHILCSKKKNLWERMQEIELMVIAATRKLGEYANVIQVTPGPLSVYRKDILKKLDGFDEENLVEDVEIAWRILKNGYKIRMAFGAFVYSLYPNSFRRWWRQRVRWAIGGIQTLSKYKSTIGNKHYAVGSFLVPTYLFGYSASILGIGIFLYLFVIRAFEFLSYTSGAVSLGLNPFARLGFAYYVDLNIIIGSIVFFLALMLFKISISLHDFKIRRRDILLFLFIYPILFPLVNLHGIYKYYKGERRWFTK